jgi:hypothetical protein
MHRERALREVNEESLQMSWTVGRIVSDKLAANTTLQGGKYRMERVLVILVRADSRITKRKIAK